MGDDRVSVAFHWPQYGSGSEDYSTALRGAGARVPAGRAGRGPEETRATSTSRVGRRPAQRDDLGRQERERRAARRARTASPIPARVPRRRPRRRARRRASRRRTRTNVTGKYIFPIPTRYQAAGGKLPPLVVERPAGMDCTAPADCAVDGLRTKTGPGRDRRPRRRAAGGDLRPRLRRLADLLPGQVHVVQPARRPGPDEHAARRGRQQPAREADGGTACSENAGPDGLLHGRGRRRHLRRHLRALREHHLARPPLRLRVGLAQGPDDGGRRSRRAGRAGARPSTASSRSCSSATRWAAS